MLNSRRLFVHLLVIFMAFSLTSCFHIAEEIFFRKNGSGTYQLTFDMSRVASMMEMMGGSNAEMDASLDEMYQEFDKVKRRMEAVDGITNARQEIDKKTMILTTTFDFASLKALNGGMSEMFNDPNNPGFEPHDYFTYSGGKLVRSDKDDLSKAIAESMSGNESPDMDPEILFADVYFESTLKFERGFKDFSNDAYYSPDKNTLKWKKYLFLRKEQDKSVGLTVKTKL